MNSPSRRDEWLILIDGSVFNQQRHTALIGQLAKILPHCTLAMPSEVLSEMMTNYVHDRPTLDYLTAEMDNQTTPFRRKHAQDIVGMETTSGTPLAILPPVAMDGRFFSITQKQNTTFHEAAIAAVKELFLPANPMRPWAAFREFAKPALEDRTTPKNVSTLLEEFINQTRQNADNADRLKQLLTYVLAKRIYSNAQQKEPRKYWRVRDFALSFEETPTAGAAVGTFLRAYHNGTLKHIGPKAVKLGECMTHLGEHAIAKRVIDEYPRGLTPKMCETYNAPRILVISNDMGFLNGTEKEHNPYPLPFRFPEMEKRTGMRVLGLNMKELALLGNRINDEIRKTNPAPEEVLPFDETLILKILQTPAFTVVGSKTDLPAPRKNTVDSFVTVAACMANAAAQRSTGPV